MSKSYIEELPQISKLKLQKAISEVKNNDSITRGPQYDEDVLQRDLYHISPDEEKSKQVSTLPLEHENQERQAIGEDSSSNYCTIL
jgi:hypothetical protein